MLAETSRVSSFLIESAYYSKVKYVSTKKYKYGIKLRAAFLYECDLKMVQRSRDRIQYNNIC